MLYLNIYFILHLLLLDNHLYVQQYNNAPATSTHHQSCTWHDVGKLRRTRDCQRRVAAHRQRSHAEQQAGAKHAPPADEPAGPRAGRRRHCTLGGLCLASLCCPAENRLKSLKTFEFRFFFYEIGFGVRDGHRSNETLPSSEATETRYGRI